MVEAVHRTTQRSLGNFVVSISESKLQRIICTNDKWYVEELFSARVPKSSAGVRRVFIHDIKEVEDVRQQEQQGDKRENEKGDEVRGERSRRDHKKRSQCA